MFDHFQFWRWVGRRLLQPDMVFYTLLAFVFLILLLFSLGLSFMLHQLQGGHHFFRRTILPRFLPYFPQHPFTKMRSWLPVDPPFSWGFFRRLIIFGHLVQRLLLNFPAVFQLGLLALLSSYTLWSAWGLVIGQVQEILFTRMLHLRWEALFDPYIGQLDWLRYERWLKFYWQQQTFGRLGGVVRIRYRLPFHGMARRWSRKFSDPRPPPWKRLRRTKWYYIRRIRWRRVGHIRSPRVHLRSWHQYPLLYGSTYLIFFLLPVQARALIAAWYDLPLIREKLKPNLRPRIYGPEWQMAELFNFVRKANYISLLFLIPQVLVMTRVFGLYSG